MADVTTNRVEEPKDLGTGDAGAWAYWNAQEKIALKGEQRWRKRGRAIVDRYRDERGAETGTGASTFHRFNIFWSNVQTLMPILYGRTPKPDVERRFKDSDPVGRYAAMILERCVSYSLDQDEFDASMIAAVQDKCLAGRGVVRGMYVPTFGDPIPDFSDAAVVDDIAGDREPASVSDNAEAKADPQREVTNEEALVGYVYWEDYLEGPARQWREVPWLRYRAYMTRDELIARFGAKKGKAVNLDFSAKGTDANDEKNVPDDLLKKAAIHETWDRTRKCVYWWAPGTPDLILDEKKDPLELRDFYPSPDPLLATTTNDKRVPVPDFVEYQDQLRELDGLTGRIDRLSRALKVAGVYAGSEKQVLQQLIEDSGENRLIPVEDWASFAIDKGGVSNLIQWLPIQQIAETLIQLYDARERVKAMIYEITGIADIMRGATDAGETAKAQALKAGFSTRRIGPQQRAVAKFARGIIRIVASIVAQQFEPKTITAITGYPQLKPVPQLPPPPPPQILGRDPQTGMGTMLPNPALGPWQQAAQAAQQIQIANQQLQAEFDAAVALLRKDAKTGFRIDIEADSTILPDEEQEKSDRIEFLGRFVPMMEQMIPQVQGNPAMASLSKEIVMFAVRGFRVARSLEESIEKAFDEMAKAPPPPSKDAARMAEISSNKEIAQTDAQVDMTKAQMQQQQAAAELQDNQMERQQRGQIAIANLAMEKEKLDQSKQMNFVKALAAQGRMARGLV